MGIHLAPFCWRFLIAERSDGLIDAFRWCFLALVFALGFVFVLISAVKGHFNGSSRSGWSNVLRGVAWEFGIRIQAWDAMDMRDIPIYITITRCIFSRILGYFWRVRLCECSGRLFLFW